MFPPSWGKIMPLDLESGLTACSIMIRRTCLLVAEWGTRIERTYTWRSDFTYGSLGIKRIVRRPAVLYEATQYAADCSLRAVFPDGGQFTKDAYACRWIRTLSGGSRNTAFALQYNTMR